MFIALNFSPALVFAPPGQVADTRCSDLAATLFQFHQSVNQTHDLVRRAGARRIQREFKCAAHLRITCMTSEAHHLFGQWRSCNKQQTG
jgi:hypothetical protein